MARTIPKLGPSRRRRIMAAARRLSDPAAYRRYHIIFLLTGGINVTTAHRMSGAARSTIYRVLDRYAADGLGGLCDRRADNGRRKVDEKFRERVAILVSKDPTQYGWCRPTWTRELLCLTMREKYGVHVSVSRMGVVLSEVGARLGRPAPVVNCPWPRKKRERRLAAIRRLESKVPKGEVLLYQDEVDIHLNPKIGFDWMLPGQQKIVVTPGKNVKRYIAGALDPSTGRLTWLEGTSKNSVLFADLIDKVMLAYSRAKRVHIVLDNYIIHKSKITQKRLLKYQGRLVLHFLPPYCPNANKIERKWQDLHAAVTRNHKCNTIDALMQRVRCHLNRAGKTSVPMRQHELRKAA